MKTITTTEKQAIAQILKMNITLGKIENEMEYVCGSDWIKIKARNEKREEKIKAIYEKIAKYTELVTEEGFDNSELPIQLCCNYEDFKS